MKKRLTHIWLQSVWLALIFAQCLASPIHAADDPAKAKALRQGEAIYTNGVLPSGEPVQATVFGNVTKTGKEVACTACHLRSGMGQLMDMEILVRPVSGAKLYAPLLGQENIPGPTMKRLMFENPRPAYTDETLAATLLTGKDPTGRELDAAMPRYLLDDDSTRMLISYLKTLSATISPGVTEDEIRFATIIGEGLSAADRDAMLLPLTAFLEDEWNARMSVLSDLTYNRLSHKGRPASGKQDRKASLEVWELHGPPETWANQLETYYARRPVFALLAGFVPGGWTPIHEFCEKNRIPCLFPITDLPGLAENDWYTLYFSKGLYLEGEVAARFLAQDAGLPLGAPVIQVSRDTDEGKALAGSFAETWKKFSEAPLTNINVSPGEQTGRDFWKKLFTANPGAAFVVWLSASDLTGIESLADENQPPPAVFLSATLLGEALPTLPDKIRDFTFIGYPTRLPGDGDYTEAIISNWLKIKNIPVTNMTISSKVYFLNTMLSRALAEMGNDFHRDFFLDLLDGASEKATASISYPMLSFGPGLRYAANGCYVVQLTHGEKPELVKKVDWFFYLGQQ